MEARNKIEFSKDILRINPDTETARICQFIREMALKNFKRKGLAVGLSGGIDSALIGELAVRALGKERVLVVEVKKKMEQHMIDEFLNKRIPKFRQIFPEYRDFPLIGGVGALVMQDAISRYAEKKGLYVMTQNGEGGAMLINRQDFRAKEF